MHNAAAYFISVVLLIKQYFYKKEFVIMQNRA